MSINRPKNINKRLTGTPNCTPGNAGQIGPTKAPYIGGPFSLGKSECGGCRGGVFRASESRCGTKEYCQNPYLGFGGNLICAASSVYWVVAPSAAEVVRDWYNRNDAITTAQSISGCTGWFIPSCAQLQNPGSNCVSYWEDVPPAPNLFWTNTEWSPNQAWMVDTSTGVAWQGNTPLRKTNGRPVRAFRCVSY
jgi:hypothetical protein